MATKKLKLIFKNNPARMGGVKGVYMALHYQVNTEYKLTHGKPSLIDLSLNSTKSAITTFSVMSDYSMLKTYRIFRTLNEAQNYIVYLKDVYKNYTYPPPVLDSGQKNLF